MIVLRPGDILLFDGSDKSDVVHIITHVLSNGIQVVSHSRWTHSAMVFDFDIPINGKPQTELNILESTILRGKNGCQLNPLSQRLVDYKDGAAVALHLKDELRDFPGFLGRMWREAANRLDHDRYNVPELLMYLARHIPIVQEIPGLYKSDDDSEVCGELLAILLRAGGLPGLRPAIMPPEAIAELAIYSGYTWLVGTPGVIPHFNSV